ncbi:MAG: hypothetical protein U9Q99_02405, partial [Nanoarchaeota archaeon]|nr:hypothetical protein [Nanoarchaeota archaeon]
SEINKQVELKNKEISKVKKVILDIKMEIENYEDKISEINSIIQKQTGLEQEQLNSEIANLRADLAAFSVKKENHEKKLKEISRQRIDLRNSIKSNEVSIKQLRKESPTIEKIRRELEIKRKELEEVEKLRKKHYMDKTELRSTRERLEDKKSILSNYENESNFLFKQIDNLSSELFDKKTTQEKVKELKNKLVHDKDLLNELQQRERELEKIIHTNESKIEENKKIIEKIDKLDICPLCKSKVTKEHIENISKEADPKIFALKQEIGSCDKEIGEIYNKRDSLIREVDSLNSEITKRQSDLSKLRSINDKNEQIKILLERISVSKEEIKEFSVKENNLENNFDANSNIEERYETLKIEVQDISLRSKENLSSEISFKERELERARITINQLFRDEEDIGEEMIIVVKNLSQKENLLEKKRKLEGELIKKAEKYISQRDDFQHKIREIENDLSYKRNDVQNIEQIVNNFKIDLARINAEIENFETEILEYPHEEILKGNKENFIERLRRSEDRLMRIGNVNMRALEVYEEVKDEYESIK